MDEIKFFDVNEEYESKKDSKSNFKFSSFRTVLKNSTGYSSPYPVPDELQIDDYVESVSSLYNRRVSKSSASPTTEVFTQVNYMPSISGQNVIEWPGISPNSLLRLFDNNWGTKLIHALRMGDITRYSRISTHAWKPGWRIDTIDGAKNPTKNQKREIQDAIRFLKYCNIQYGENDIIERGALGYRSFGEYLCALASDLLRFDSMATWTDRDSEGRVKAFAGLPAYLIKLCTSAGYNNDPSKFAVLVDATQNVQKTFTRDELLWSVGNTRNDQGVFGYGWSATNQGADIITAFQNAIQINADLFNKNSIPNGMIVMTGDYMNQKQVDLMGRSWFNMVHGVTKFWTMPAINIPEKAKFEILSFKDIKGADVLYKDFINIAASLLFGFYGVSPARFGFHPSGHSRDSQPPADQSTSIIGDDDPGLPQFLINLEEHVDVILKSRFPNLAFTFTGKNPKDDAREYEARTQAQTFREKRAYADLPSMEELFPDNFDTQKLGKMAGILLDNVPNDANMISAYVSIISLVVGAALKKDGLDSDADGNLHAATTGEKLDPNKSIRHGGQAGVRRDSAKEKGKKVG